MSFMQKKPKVVPITPERTNSDERQVVAQDAITRRYLFTIGPRRFAFDWTSRITKLSLGRGEEPASVVPFPKQKKLRRTAK
jgi:hypothetical protein